MKVLLLVGVTALFVAGCKVPKGPPQQSTPTNEATAASNSPGSLE